MKWVMLACALAACAEETRDKPEPPDMSALVAAYESPSSPFDSSAAADVESVVEQKVKALFDLDKLAAKLDEVLAALGADDQPAAFAPVVLEGEGFARVERICSGHGSPPPPIDKAANGFLELTAGYSERGLDPVVFGGAVDCREQAGDVRLTVAGDIHLFIGNNVQAGQTVTTPIVFELANFDFSVNDVSVVSGGFDFQLCRGTNTTCVPGHFEILVGLPNGTSLVFFIDLATKAGGFRAANGLWTCDFGSGQCTDGGGGVVTIPAYQL